MKSTSVSVGSNLTALKWNTIFFGNVTVGSTGSPNTFSANDRVTVISTRTSGTLDKQLIMGGGAMYLTMPDAIGTIPATFQPTTGGQSYVVYGVDPATNLRMPFNRADYYIARPPTHLKGARRGLVCFIRRR